MVALTERLVALDAILRDASIIALTARDQIVSELKKDGSIVTNGDRAVETYLRSVLPDFAPGSAFWGEEFGFEPESEGGLWVVDPIDGTSNYSFGGPLWGISVALVKGDEILLGGVYLPDLKEMYLAELGKGAFMNGNRIAPIPEGEIRPQELVSYGDAILKQFGDQFLPGKMRLSGAFVIEGCFTAMQRWRGMIGHRERLYDVAACVLLCQEAGAQVRYADGRPFVISEISQPVPIPGPWIIFPKGSEFRIS